VDLKDFGKRARQLGKNVNVNADRLTRKCALAIDGAVVLATPVDTGRARANWQVSCDTPITTQRPPYSSGAEGSTGGANARSALEQGKAAIANYKGGTPGSAIYIANNLSYIGGLNAGNSKQMPAGFVERSILIGTDAIKNESLIKRSTSIE
jgi:hypothetical protein